MRLVPAATRLFLIPVLAIAFSACASTQSPQEEAAAGQPVAVVTPAAATVTVPTEIATIRPSLITAWQGTDPAALKVYFMDDAVVTTPMGTYTGWTDISGKWITPVFPVTKYTLTPTTFTREGDLIVESGNFAYVVTKDNAPQNISGTYVYRWSKGSDGVWRLKAVEVK